MDNNYKISYANKNDLDNLLNVLNQLSETKKVHELQAIFHAIIDNPMYSLIVVKQHNNNVVGTAMLTTRHNLSHNGKRVGYLENVVVDKNHRGNKLGAKMVEFLKEEAKRLNCYKIILDCSQENSFFYNKYDFEITDEINMRLNIE